jgi:hypothetical protein
MIIIDHAKKYREAALPNEPQLADMLLRWRAQTKWWWCDRFCPPQ